MSQTLVSLSLALFITLHCGTLQVQSADGPITVNVDNFARAETDMQIGRLLEATKGVNKWSHNRLPTPIEKQNVIRMNRDTLYSSALVDISEGATVTLPDVGDRHLSLMVVNNDGYINKVFHGGDTYELTEEEFDTPYVILSARMLVNAADDKDIKAANALQDQMKIDAASAKKFVMPSYDMERYKATYGPLLELAKGVPDKREMFGSKKKVDPVRFLIGSAFGWGGLPIEEAYYLNVNPELPVGKYQITVKDVPVEAFWSISVYNKEGYFEKNDLDVYSVNNISGKPNEDGSFTVYLGGCDDGRTNCIPLTEGWNYAVRLYKPRPEILEGSWVFPSPEPAR